MKDSVVGEERLARYFLSVLNNRNTPLHWKNLNNERSGSLSEAITRNKKIFKASLRRTGQQLDHSDVWYIEVIYLDSFHITTRLMYEEKCLYFP